MSALARAAVTLVLLGASPAAAEAPPWCVEAKARLAALSPDVTGAWTRYVEIVGALPPEAAPLVEHARQRAGAAGELSAALDVMRRGLEDGCAPVRGNAAQARAEVTAILADETRFAGTRTQPDVLDRLLAALGEWLLELLESTAMQRYAEASRVIFLSGLAVLIAFVAVRLWRARAGERRDALASGPSLAVERERVRAFAEWRREADLRRAAGDLRGALRAGQMALLARLGEVDADAVTPARTHREILRHASEAVRAVVERPLERFDRLFFGGREAPDAVDGFLALVDEAARALSEARR